MYAQGQSQVQVAKALGRDKSVICRELKRNRQGAERRRIAQHLRKGQWSPEQIAGRCRVKGIPMVGTTRIYEFIRKAKAKAKEKARVQNA